MRGHATSSDDVRPSRNLFIARGKVVRIEEGHHAVLRVEDGSVWITQHGSKEDVVLQAGDSFRVAPDRIILISTCGFSTTTALVSIERNVPGVPLLRSRIAESFHNLWAGLGRGTTPRWYF